jgi:hypothetical protein
VESGTRGRIGLSCELEVDSEGMARREGEGLHQDLEGGRIWSREKKTA